MAADAVRVGKAASVNRGLAGASGARKFGPIMQPVVAIVAATAMIVTRAGGQRLTFGMEGATMGIAWIVFLY